MDDSKQDRNDGKVPKLKPSSMQKHFENQSSSSLSVMIYGGRSKEEITKLMSDRLNFPIHKHYELRFEEEASQRTQDILNNEGCVICGQSSPPLNNNSSNNSNNNNNSKYGSAVVLTCRGINSDCLHAIHCTCVNNGALTKNFLERHHVTIVTNGMSLTMNDFHQNTRGVTLNGNAKTSRVLQVQLSFSHVVSSTRQKTIFIGDMHAVLQTKYVLFACVLI